MMAKRSLLVDERGISTIVGAIVLLAVLGIAIVSVNAYHVPQQGVAIEMAAREHAEATFLSLAADLSDERGAPFVADIALRAQAPPPPLLSGIILEPVIAEGRLAFLPNATRVTVSHVVAAPASGVPAGDPMRVALSGGLMRVFTMGNATAGQSVGTLALDVGGAHLETATHRLELGSVLVVRESGSSPVAPGGLVVAAGGTAGDPTTSLSWRLPLITGAASETAGGSAAQVLLSPGPLAKVGGGQRVHNVTIEIETDALAAWESLLRVSVGRHGVVTSVATGPDSGKVTATILPPAVATAGIPSVEMDLSATRYVVSLTGRSAG